VTLDGGTAWTVTVNNCVVCNGTGGDDVEVCPGATIAVVYSVQLTAGDNWTHTGWIVEGASEVCANTPDFSSGTNSVSFNITAPLIPNAVGYDLTLDADNNNTCTTGDGGLILLPDAIKVRTAAASDATCDGVDDDCNGAVDEDYVSTTTTCGVGACASTGSTSCVGGTVVDSCTPGSPAASDTTCNSIDDDCDGAVDENAVNCCGNNIANGTEECDGTDADACSGECRADCTCPPPPTGACCDQLTDTCTEGLTEAECADDSADQNRWGGEGSTCATIDPPCQPCQEPCSACSSKTGEGTREVEVILEDINYDGTTTTFTYRLCQAPASQDLSHWVLGLSQACCDILEDANGGTSAGSSCQIDPSTGLFGLKWETNGGIPDCAAPACDATGGALFTVTLEGQVVTTECAKAVNKIDGPPAGAFGCVLAPSCGCETDTDCPSSTAKCMDSFCDTDANTCRTSAIVGCCDHDDDCPDMACRDGFCDHAEATDLTDNMCDARPVSGCCVNDADCPDTAACQDSFCNTDDPGDPLDNFCDTREVSSCCISDTECPDTSKCIDSFCNFGNPADPTDNFCDATARPGCCDSDADCPDVTPCTDNFCDPSDNSCKPRSICEACCLTGGGTGLVAGGSGDGCQDLPPAECSSQGGTPQGSGSACGPNTCPVACCFSNGSCKPLAPSVCELASGTAQAPGTDCDPNRCPAPACCFPDGHCDQSPVPDCLNRGGLPSAPGTTCDPNACPSPTGACCLLEAPTAGIGVGPVCVVLTEKECVGFANDPSAYQGDFTDCEPNPCMAPDRVDATKKGSLLVYSKIELKWDAAGRLKQDTILTIINDYPEDVHVQWYFINGDEPLDAVISPAPPFGVLERAHRGWNWMDCQNELTEDESTYIAMSSGRPMGCQPFTALDPGTPPGRPDPDAPPGHRMLRGYAIAFAVDASGDKISWNHLSGGGNLVDYSLPAAWDYGAYAFQKANKPVGEPTTSPPGTLNLDGLEYDQCFDKLLFDFFAVGSTAYSKPAQGVTVTLDTDLTLFPVSADLRQDVEGRGPVTTKAKFDIWNENEDFLSGTTRCITCWDQALLSTYDPPNNFLLAHLQTHKGKARIDGVESEVCENCEFIRVCGETSPFTCEWIEVCEFESEDACLLGVAAKILDYSGTVSGRATAGNTIVGQGDDSATILYDIRSGPDSATDHEVRFPLQRNGTAPRNKHLRLPTP
jgi:hypothetical protein